MACIFVSVLFYNSPWGICSLPLLFFFIHKCLKKSQDRKELARLHMEFKDYLLAVSSALLAGNSIEKAFLGALREHGQLYGEGSLLCRRLGGMQQRLLVQEPLERILSDFADESKSGDIEGFVEVFGCAKRGGGDFVHILSTSIGRICDKMEVSEEIHAVMAQKEMEQKVMCIAPVGILLFFRLSAPEFIGKLYGNFLGICVMSGALFLYGAAFLLGMKIVEIEV